MGTRINLLLEHDLADFRDPGELLARLLLATRDSEAVREYWRASVPVGPHNLHPAWEADPLCPREPGLRRFTGPGSLFLGVTASAAHVRTGGRWRGFLAIEQLRRVHLLAFRAIARALGAGFMVLYADSDEVDGLFWDGRPPRECVERMEQMWGPPQDSVEDIDPSITAAAELYLSHPVWFLEGVEGGACPEP